MTADGAIGSALEDLEARAAKWPVPGLQIAAVADGQDVFAGGFGKTAAVGGEPVTERTLFSHGSCTKAFTGLLAAVLEAEGIVSLDAPVRRYVPELTLPDPVIAERATMRDLLSHRSGLGRNDMVWICHPDWPAEEIVGRLEHLPLAGDLRAQMVYSNIGYTLAALAMSRAAGLGWTELISDRVLQPLGMLSTFAGPEPAPDGAVPHLLRDNTPVPTPPRPLGAAAPAGLIMTTALDAAKWLLLQSGSGEGKLEHLAPATHRLHVPMPAEMVPWPELKLHGYGLGWLVATYRGRPFVWHAGGVDGVLTETMVLPDDGVGVVVSANVHMSDLPMPAGLSLIDTLLGEGSDTDWYSRVGHVDAQKGHVDAQKTDEPKEPVTSKGAPSRDLEVLVGTYSHEGYGDLVAERSGEGFVFRLGEVVFDVDHRHYDTWTLRYDVLDFTAPATFCADASGDVAELAVAFEDGTDPIRFKRK